MTAVCTLGVPDVEAAVAPVEAAGGPVLMPRMAIAGGGRVAFSGDTEGCVFGVMEAGRSAAHDARGARSTSPRR